MISVPSTLDELVIARPKEPGGPWFIELTHGRGPSVRFGPYQNPAVAKRAAKGVREVLARMLEQRSG